MAKSFSSRESIFRNRTLDSVRGLAIFLMILVNFPGSWGKMYAPLVHAKGDGFTLADIVFPTFLWAVGYSIFHSLEKNKDRSTVSIALLVLRRSMLLVSAGLLLNYLPDKNLETMRIPGVLQRIAICYFFVLLGFRFLSFRQAVITFLSIGLCLSLLNRFVIYGANGFEFSSVNPDISSSLGATLDRFLFGSHVWKDAKTFDPEGLLTTLISILSVLLGVTAAARYESGRDWRTSLFWIIAYIILGVILLPMFPCNKTQWSLSYILLSTGIIESVYLILRSIPKLDSITSFMVGGLGRHALLLFFLTGVIARSSVYAKVRSEVFKRIMLYTTDANMSSLIYSLLIFFSIFLIFKIVSFFYFRFKSLSMRLPASFRFVSK
jgi:predicted acyltransferase